jgi:histidine triad (HIT) family protein
MADSIFTRIIKGEIPCHKVYEDADVLAFLDIRPVNPGHTLVIPKAQVDHFSDLDEATTQKVMAVVQKISRAVRKVYNPQRVALVVIGDEVPHAHVHVIPYYQHGDVSLKANAAEPDHAALAATAATLKQGL